MKTNLYGTGADADFPVDPANWRTLPEPENHDQDDDEDLPVSDEVRDILGLDPDELDWDEDDTDEYEEESDDEE